MSSSHTGHLAIVSLLTYSYWDSCYYCGLANEVHSRRGPHTYVYHVEKYCDGRSFDWQELLLVTHHFLPCISIDFKLDYTKGVSISTIHIHTYTYTYTYTCTYTYTYSYTYIQQFVRQLWTSHDKIVSLEYRCSVKTTGNRTVLSTSNLCLTVC